MRVLGVLLFCITFPLLAATELTTQVYEIDYGLKPDDEVLVMLASGHVAKIAKDEKSLISHLQGSKIKEAWFTFNLDDDRYITQIRPAKALVETDFNEFFSSLKGIQNSYVPTTIDSMSTAQKYHRSGRRNSKDSQCFNRAMVWTYDWWKNHSLKSMKILIFFTRNYIRRYNFEWWFHIAPYVHVIDEGRVVERVMDLKYTSRPTEFRKWTNIFMKNDAACPVITRYSEYADFPYSGECFIMRTEMYTYQPADLQMLEAWGYKKDRFNLDEVKAAFLEAYDMHL